MRQQEGVSGNGADSRGILALLRDLAESGGDLAHNTARMVASESRVVLHRLAVRLGLYAAGILVAAAGLLLVLAGASLVLARLAGVEEWLALVVVGAVTLAAGVVFALRALRRLGEPDLAFPATLAEFREDIETLRGRRTGDPEEAP